MVALKIQLACSTHVTDQMASLSAQEKHCYQTRKKRSKCAVTFDADDYIFERRKARSSFDTSQLRATSVLNTNGDRTAAGPEADFLFFIR